MMPKVAVLTVSHQGGNKQASHSSGKCSSAASQTENQKANHLKCVYSPWETAMLHYPSEMPVHQGTQHGE